MSKWKSWVSLIVIIFGLAVSVLTPGQVKENKMQEELLTLEKEFSEAIVKNDTETIG